MEFTENERQAYDLLANCLRHMRKQGLTEQANEVASFLSGKEYVGSETKLAEAMFLLDEGARLFRYYQGQHLGKSMDTRRNEADRQESRNKATINATMAATYEQFIRGASVDAPFDYHDLAMRTAAGPEVFHYPKPTPGQDELGVHIVVDCINFISAASKLDKHKSSLFYNKNKDVRDRLQVIDTIEERTGMKFGDLRFEFENCFNPQAVHAILGIATESAELIEDLLILLAENVSMPVREAVLLNVSRETGDVDWYQELLAHVIGVPVDQSRRENIVRLRKRFPGKFSEADAVARADEGDADA